MSGPHLCEAESWPGYGPEPSGRWPSPNLLSVLAGLAVANQTPAASSYSSFDGIGGVFLIGAGSLLAGVALMLAARRWLPAFFTTATLPPLPEDGDDAAPSAGRPTPVPARVLDPA
jgi:hypothetical protein